MPHLRYAGPDMPSLRLLVTGGSALAPYVVTAPSGGKRGEIRRPTWPKQPTELEFEGAQYRIVYQSTKGGFLADDARFDLMSGDTVAAWATKRVGDKAFDLHAHGNAYRLANRNRWLRMHFVLEDGNGRQRGEVVETTGLSLWRRSFEVNMPESLGGPAAMFAFFLAANHTYN